MQRRKVWTSSIVAREVTTCVRCTDVHVPCAPLQLLEGNKYLLQALGSGIWPVMVLVSEIVQTFILADFW